MIMLLHVLPVSQPYDDDCLQVSELKVTVDRLTRDKSSVVSELHAVKEELELNSFRGKGAGGNG